MKKDLNFNGGFTFKKHTPEDISHFDRVFEVFKDLLTHTSGDIEEAFEWLEMLDKEYDIFTDEYTLADFEEDLKKRGYIKEEKEPEEGNTGTGKGKNILTPKLEKALREFALDQIFGKLKKTGVGNHRTSKVGVGDERDGETRTFQYGDDLNTVNMTESLKNAQINNGIADLRLTEDNLVVEETRHKAQMSTVLMIDISHSMILYGEDRITPAKKVAMALVELIKRKYPKDSIDIIVFGNEAWPIKIKDLP
ncbi:MAG: hypothetical protein ACXWB6_01265, partial [Kaistella sp.]